MVHRQRASKNPETTFVAMMAIVARQVCCRTGKSYWAYLPDPPVANPASWASPSIFVFTNDTRVVGGHSASHISPTLRGGFNYTSLGATPPICLSSTEKTGCVLLQQENQIAYGGIEIAIITGP